MTQTPQPGGGGASGSAHRPDVDWPAVARAPEFQELIKARRRFVVPATVFFLAWYFGFIILAGYAEDFMGREFITDGVTVGYALAFTQFIMVWVLVWLYLRVSDRKFDPLSQKAAQRAHEQSGAYGGDGAPRPAGEDVRPS